MIKVIKKDGTTTEFDKSKIIRAVNKSAERVMTTLTDEELDRICKEVYINICDSNKDDISVTSLHNMVESALDKVNHNIAVSYKEYRNYKTDFVGMLDEVYSKSQSIMYLGDKSNSNTDSALVTTKRSLVYGELNKELYNKFFLTQEERQACRDGYIYIHDKSARRDTMNCCLFDAKSVMTGGFEMGNIWYNEPKSIDTACDVLGDIIMMSASMQYGGWSTRVDDLLAPYVEKSYNMYKNELIDICTFLNVLSNAEEYIEQKALDKANRDLEQGIQGLEIKLNSVASSRGDYPFTTFAIGLGELKFERMVSKAVLNVRMNGQGKEGYKRPVLFPKIIFLYDENLHGAGKKLEDIFDLAILCSSKAMYPDFLSLTGESYVSNMYKKYGSIIYPMGCVDGQEIITYKINDKLYVESFERMWNRLSSISTIKEQESKDNYYMDLKDVLIYDTKNGFVNTKRIIKNKDKGDWTRIKFSNGRSLLATSDHPLPIINQGRTFVKDLKIGDKININQSQYSEDSIMYNIDKAWLLGFLLCDGCYDDQVSSSIALTGEDDIETNYKKIFKELYNLDVKTVVWNRGKRGDYKELKIGIEKYEDYKKVQLELLEIFGGKQKIYRQIPNEVFSWNKEAKLSFLAGMIDADGYINSTGHCGSTVQIGSTNKELALQTMALSQSLGLPTKVYLNHYTSNDKNKIRYRIEFSATIELLKYMACHKKIDCFTREANITKINESSVTSIEFLGDINKFSYDVATESDHFEVSGIYSHNCRAFLSPWYERGGMFPIDEYDKPVYTGRFNIGAITLNMIMILAKAREENKDFYEVLDYYMEMIRKIHIRTYDYLGKMKASTNPLGYCEGGFYGGNLKPNECIAKILKPMTASFGITGLNELQELYNSMSLVEDGEFTLDVMKYINAKVDQFKVEDGWLYAIYGTPAESLCGLQIEQFRAKYGIIKNVSDREYTSNSFHCHVTEDILPTQKQDLEYRYWDLFNGGKIQYVRYPLGYNLEAIKIIIKRAMDLGLYEGVNMALSYCNECGHQEENMDTCPVCGSYNLTKIDRMNGYLSYSRVKGDTTLNQSKMAEIKERKSM